MDSFFVMETGSRTGTGNSQALGRLALSKHHIDSLSKKQRTLGGLPLRTGARLNEIERKEQCREKRAQSERNLPTAWQEEGERAESSHFI